MIGVLTDCCRKRAFEQILAAKQVDQFGMAAEMLVGEIE